MRGWYTLTAAAIVVVGAMFWVTKLQADVPPRAPAPEIQAKEWLNSKPLTLSGLRGKVVALEFWTYG